MKIFRIITVLGVLITQAGCELEVSDSNESKAEVLPEVIFTMPEANATSIDIYSKVLIATNTEFSLENVELFVKIHNKSIDSVVEGEYLVEGTNIIFTPTTSLGFNTEYEIVIDSQLNDISGKNLTENNLLAFTTEIDPVIKEYDGVFPELLFSYPKSGDVSVRINSTINLILNSPVFLNDAQQFIIIKNRESNSVVSGEFSIIDNVVSFLPENHFDYGVNYEIIISSDLANIVGNSFITDEIVSFQSEEIPLDPVIGSWTCIAADGSSGFLAFREGGGYSESGVSIFNGWASRWARGSEGVYIITGNGTNASNITFTNENQNMHVVPDRSYLDTLDCTKS